MKDVYIITLALAIFITINLIYYKSLNAYVKKTFDKNWLQVWGNKVYFWQGSIFVSTGATFLIMYVLKWLNVLSF